MTAVQTSAAYQADQRFFTRLALALAALIVFGFAQWALRGFVDPLKTPIWIHLHGIAMLGWLALIVTQNSLAERGNMALHRQLGWLGLVLVAAIVGLGMFSGRMALALHRVPPFFTDSYFLALTHVEVVAFASLVGTAIALRRNTQWHRRLMFGATVILMEPALGRLLPMPLLGQTVGGWIEAGLQVGFLAILARHDRKVAGSVHPATLLAMAAVVGVHAVIQLLAGSPAIAAIAQAIAQGHGHA
ncbi:MAG: adenylate cyclase [Novosphingobium sp.]|jgi:hypothetical protein|uniref:adenylate cyclase n=1 Tax=Novosphingobium sp. TaxID=1874826 RepID=UPI0030175CA5